MAFNIEHGIALIFIGTGATLLLYTGHTEAGIALYGVLGGYAFRNGIMKKNSQSSQPIN